MLSGRMGIHRTLDAATQHNSSRTEASAAAGAHAGEDDNVKLLALEGVDCLYHHLQAVGWWGWRKVQAAGCLGAD